MQFDPYCYPGTNVLINKFNVRTNEALDIIEGNITSINLSCFDDIKLLFSDGFNFDSLLDLHRFIFGDIYEWAGTIRETEISKREKLLGGSVKYAYPSAIKIKASHCIDHLNKQDWKRLSLDYKIELFAKGIADLWQVHPFREGNTRTIITFACEFADANGFPIDRSLLSQNSKYTRDALVLASIGKYSEHQHLIKIFKDSLEQEENIHYSKAEQAEDEIILPYESLNNYYHK